MIKVNTIVTSSLRNAFTGALGISLHTRLPEGLPSAVEILSRDEIVIDREVRLNPVNGQGQFEYRNLSRNVRALFESDHIATSGTLRLGINGRLARPNELQAQQSRARWHKAHHKSLELVGKLQKLNMHEITLLNIALKYEYDPDLVFLLHETSSKLDAEWDAIQNAPDTRTDAWMDRVNDHIEERGKAYVGDVRVISYSLHNPLYRRHAPIVGGAHWRGETVRGWYGRPKDLMPYLPITENVIHDNNTHPVVKAAKVYQDLLTIHMYADANGRVARLVAEIILMTYGYPPLFFEGKLPMVVNLERLESPDHCSTVPHEEYVSVGDVVLIFMEALKSAEQKIRETGVDYSLPDYGFLPDADIMDKMTLLPHLIAEERALAVSAT